MKIELSLQAGFCYGVRRSVDGLNELLAAGQRLTMLGPLIHNPQVVDRFLQRGARLAMTADEIQEGIVVVASHGTSPSVLAELAARGLAVADLSCPDVAKVHQRAAEHDGALILVGERDHPELLATRAWAKGEVFFIENESAVENLPASLSSPLVLAQTTFIRSHFLRIVEALRARYPEIEVFDSICPATSARQRAAAELAARVDLMLVLGSRQSANTQRLFETSKRLCERSYLIASPQELEGIPFRREDHVGITAGASTPDEIIKEVVTRMSELDKNLPNPTDEPATEETAAFEQPTAPASIEEVVAAEEDAAGSDPGAEPEFAAAFEQTMVSIRPGLTVTGTVVQVTEGEVCVNIGYKSDGLIPRAELTTSENPLEAYKIGDEIEVEVVKVNDGEGNVLLSQKNIVNRKTWDSLVEKFENNEYIEGVGQSVVKGGLLVDVQGIRTFVPASQLSERYVEKIDQFIGKELRLKVIEADRQKRRLVASRKAVLAEESAEKKAVAWEKLEVGKVVQGVVRRLTDFGAFVDLGGVDGLIHITDLSWGRVKHPSVIVKPGEELEVLILALDRERERISLGLKQTKPKPWETATVNYPAGSIVEGKVVRIVPFGAFVELEPGLDGLVHISQVAEERIAKVEDRLTIGDTVRVRVLDVNPDTKRISLSIRQTDSYGEGTELPEGDEGLEFADLPPEEIEEIEEVDGAEEEIAAAESEEGEEEV
ncbi:MAG: bifunctional 4-hydroxy-3-methylbut-2-enyl diphosphate reductase/30S ribosomal protein S1 [Christensenellaceae bacterium]|jgi:4-hydroxy-3-methylbut-2-enyl diphosphate reductase|nr:bifunctional 4-hydroxy-3-methylbut-2-enyl diphosphate reductase/30S ribosomal protein S1 [Christensenellaceae bacterium]